MGARRGGRRWTALISVAVVVAVAAALVPLVSYLAPRILPNLFTSVSDIAADQTITDGEATATVLVPAGWVAQRAWGSESELMLRSPDGRFAVTLALSPEDAADAVVAEEAVSGAAPVLERLGSGLDAAHAQSDDVLVVAVGAGPSVLFESTATPAELAPYRPAIADLIESVRVSS